MKNLEQIRAASAMAFAKEVEAGTSHAGGVEGGEAIKKIPPMIMGNGLLATIAFSLENRREGYASILTALAKHLASPAINITPGVTDAKHLIEFLSQEDSSTLKLATAEALEWFGYARRFVKSPDRRTR
jgi:CRISPR/Cas system CMR-associated protein Cmr5 small subunit